MHFNEKTLINLLRFNLLALFVLLVFERRLSSQTVNESKSYSIQSNSNTTDSASKILAQIGRLASKNVPIKVDTTMTLVEELNPEFDWNLQRPVDEAIRSLKKTGRPAFKFLIENIDNKSFSRPVLGSIWVNQSVGGVCKAIISSQVDFGKALGDTHKPEAVLPSLTSFATERFLLLRQIVVNCFNLKEINSVHLNP